MGISRKNADAALTLLNMRRRSPKSACIEDLSASVDSVVVSCTLDSLLLP